MLVVAVLVGLVAMHGLGPFGAPDAARTIPTTGHAISVPTAVGGFGSDACVHSGHGAGGHLEHADATCAAGGTSSGPSLPVLLPVATAPAADTAGTPQVPAALLGGRAPPSLSELQLLRI
ncbi:hypothetical protein F0L17_24020 [Streptomyces sp. TRM43335]|uniref:Chaplin domain-containing protein n=1 Tax=Streptomyces taklimakanensis TaxID=2569853 RepID=A0A6G2BIK1_9ACTN|nr:hypothetical protein [Streptomyces taklimakanensis]